MYELNIIKKIKTTKKASKRYQKLSNEEKKEKQKYGRECYKNPSEDETLKLFKYRKKYYTMKKMPCYNCKIILF